MVAAVPDVLCSAKMLRPGREDDAPGSHLPVQLRHRDGLVRGRKHRGLLPDLDCVRQRGVHDGHGQGLERVGGIGLEMQLRAEFTSAQQT